MEFPNEKLDLWLFKVPNHIYSFIKEKKASEEIGSLNLSKGSFDINLNNKQPYPLSLKLKKCSNSMFLLRDKKETAHLLERVTHSGQFFDNNSNKNESFGLSREKNNEDSKPNIIEQQIDDKEKRIIFNLHAYHNEILFPPRNSDKLDESKIKERLFAIFENQRTVSFSEINEFIPGQQKKYLEDIIKKYCDIVKPAPGISKNQQSKGNKNYQLKPEFILTLFLCISTASDCFILQKGIEKDERLVIIDRHNEIRQQIALGKNLDLPSSSKMYELQWDYHLAELAQSESEICTDEWEEKNNEFQEDEIKTSYYTYHVSTMYQNMNLNTPLNIWFSKGNLIRKIDIINGILDEKIGPFVNLVYGKNIKVGCGLTKIYENSWWKVNFICKYEALPHNKFDSVYEIGFACEKCTDSCSKIWEGLCSNPSIL